MIALGADATTINSAVKKITLYVAISALIFFTLVSYLFSPKEIIHPGQTDDIVRVSVYFSRDTTEIIPPPYGDSLRKIYIDTDLSGYSPETKAFSYVYQMDDALKDSLTNNLLQHKMKLSFEKTKATNGYHIRYYLSDGTNLKVFIADDNAETSYVTREGRCFKLLNCDDFKRDVIESIDDFLFVKAT